ncbi:hypothetical protein ACFQQB_19565 [Nonomuraea rubra]
MAELAENTPRRPTGPVVVASAMAVASPLLSLAAILVWAGLPPSGSPARR